MLLASESARSVTHDPDWTAGADPAGLVKASALARATASVSAIEVTGSTIQACGGIGFTWHADIQEGYNRAQQSAPRPVSTGHHLERLASLVADRAPVDAR